MMRQGTLFQVLVKIARQILQCDGRHAGTIMEPLWLSNLMDFGFPDSILLIREISVTCHAALLANAFGVARAEEDPRLKKFTENRALSGGDISGALTIGKARVKLWM